MDIDGESEPLEDVISAMEQSAAEYGFPRSCGRIYGLLYFADEPQSLDDLAAQSGYAKSTVSDATRVLENVFMIRRVSPPEGGRRAYFVAERDLWTAIRQIMDGAVRREFHLMQRALDDAEAALQEHDINHSTIDRINHLQTVYTQFERIVDTLEQIPADRLHALMEQIDAEGVEPVLGRALAADKEADR